jgi:hypothetical protein
MLCSLRQRYHTPAPVNVITAFIFSTLLQTAVKFALWK